MSEGVVNSPDAEVNVDQYIHSREYGGGDDRWAVYRGSIEKRLWDALCPGSHPEDRFVEFHDRREAEVAVRKALASLPKFQVGQRVRKMRGYTFEGVVVAAFETLAKERRVVVELDAVLGGGLLHIFNESQMELC